jgi:type I restriction enzyme S subunit
MQKEIKSNASATTLPILNKGNFAKLPFPLPPYNEQHRIVTKIKELFSRLDSIQNQLEI